jgi:hypothetical protein
MTRVDIKKKLTTYNLQGKGELDSENWEKIEFGGHAGKNQGNSQRIKLSRKQDFDNFASLQSKINNQRRNF